MQSIQDEPLVCQIITSNGAYFVAISFLLKFDSNNSRDSQHMPWEFFFSLHFTMEAQLLFTNRMRFKTAIYRTNIPRRLQLLNCNLLGKWFYACKDFPPFGCEYLRAGKPKSRIYSSEGLDLTFLPCILDSRRKPHLQLQAEDDANAAAGGRSLRNVTRPIHF